MSLAINLHEKKAMVSGVSSGIGGGIARMLAQAGCDVSGCGLDATNSKGTQQFFQSVEEAGRKALYTELDLTDPNEIKRWVQLTGETLGGIDILISNAGQNIFKGAGECTEETWDHNLNINLAAHWRLAKASYPYLKQSGSGVVIVITSNHAHNTMPGCFPYNVTKAGLLGLVQSLAIEWGPAVRAVGIAPGYTETAALHDLIDKYPDAKAEIDKILALHPVYRMGSVNEIGALCAFLASDWAGFITGSTILVDGGRSALMQDDTKYGSDLP